MVYHILFSFILIQNLIQIGYSSNMIMKKQILRKPIPDPESCQACPTVFQEVSENQSSGSILFNALDCFLGVKNIETMHHFIGLLYVTTLFNIFFLF